MVLYESSCWYNIPAIQTRGFKTDRNITAEKTRNPSLAARIREMIKPSIISGSPQKTPVIENLPEGDIDRLKGKIDIGLFPLLHFMLLEYWNTYVW